YEFLNPQNGSRDAELKRVCGWLLPNWLKNIFSVWSRCCEIQAGDGQAPVWPPEMILRCIDDGCTSCGEKGKSYGPQSPTDGPRSKQSCRAALQGKSHDRCRANRCGIER